MVKAKVEAKEAGSALISQKDMLDRENKYLQRMQDVSVSCGFIKDAISEFERLEGEKAREDHWEHYIRCDGLPRPYLPPEMRTFLAEKRHYQLFDYNHSVDWTLSVDERTILSQDIFRTDKTRNAMKQTLDDHIGDRFQRDVFMFLDTLMKIECMLDNNAEMSRISFEKQMEIMEVRKELEQEIDGIFDRLTYRIIRMDNVYMDSNDAIVATWGHNCDRFAIDIWGLRNVPIRFNELLAPLMVAELPNVGVSVQMPLSVLHDCLTLRCIHTLFDNYSQYAKSFDPMIPESIKDLTAGIIDIEDCLANEWLMQLDIQEELLESMLQKREAYEEAVRIIAEKTEKAAKEKKANEGKKTKAVVIPKPPKEPPAVPPGMLPDAYSTFLEREQQEYLDLLDQLYNPQNLKLMLDEINLRQYILLGGLYSIMFVRRPANTHFEKFNIILHEDGRILHTMENLVADLRPKQEDTSRRGSRLSQRASNVSSRSKSRMHLKMDQQKRKTTMLEDDELPYFFVTLHLPKELCMWGEPVVCQYMSHMQEVVSDNSLVEEKKESFAIKKKKSKGESFKRSLLEERQSMFTKVVRKATVENVFRPTLISMLRHSRIQMPGVWTAPIRNFPLDKQLTHLEIRQLERYGIPRVISSFKFPMEVRAELEQLGAASRPKNRNMLIRRRSADIEDTIDFGYIDFSFKDQHAPERVFPVFSDVETVMYRDESFLEEYTDEKNMYGLLNLFEKIRTEYNTQYVAIMNQADFQMKKADKTKKTAVVPVTEIRPLSVVGRPKSVVNKRDSRQSSIRGSHLGLNVSQSNSRTGSSFHMVDNSSGEDLLTEQVSSVVYEEKEEKPKVKVVHWTTQHIISSKFNRSARTMTVRTDRLGIFGLAFKRYEHFPFRDWSMQPNEENPDEILLTVDTFHARIVLYISAQGVRGYVTDIVKGYVAKPVKYLDIPTPISDFRVLRKKLYDKGINIFAEHDASYYIDNGYFSVKHVATEDHTYDAMALHCKLMKFYRSSWNRLASRRNILLCMKNAKDQSDYTEVTIRITPDSATFVEVSELCSDDLDVIKLDFKNTWRNMANYTDLHQTINSMNPHATDVRNKDALLLFRIKRMLSEIHLMSYS
ncbi:hypothetical protein ACLKA7_017442 [Drosophila subpalustris]